MPESRLERTRKAYVMTSHELIVAALKDIEPFPNEQSFSELNAMIDRWAMICPKCLQRICSCGKITAPSA